MLDSGSCRMPASDGVRSCRITEKACCLQKCDDKAVMGVAGCKCGGGDVVQRVKLPRRYPEWIFLGTALSATLSNCTVGCRMAC